MKSLQLLVFASLQAAIFATAYNQDCPQALCADPRYDPATGCNSCEHSQCLFSGCVRYGAFGPTWRPDNCTQCFCEHHRPMNSTSSCITTQCPSEIDCYGYPTIHKPGRCCPECDYGLSDDECGLIPHRTELLNLTLGYASCEDEILFHRCNTNYIIEGSDWFVCQLNMSRVMKKLSHKCRFNTYISHVTYEDITTCGKRLLQPHEFPQDYDSDPYSCTLYVDPEVET